MYTTERAYVTPDQIDTGMPNVALRFIVPAHAPELSAAISSSPEHLSSEFGEADGLEAYKTVDGTRRRIELELELPGDQYALWVGRRIVGGGVRFDSYTPDESIIGYWVAESATKQGYGSLIANALLRHCFETRDDFRVGARTRPQNTPSQGLLQKLGFRQDHAGEYHHYSILKRQYMEQH